MQVTVSLKIHLDATASLSEMERQIRAAGQEAMKQALEQAIHQSEEQQKRCPTCGSDQLPELRTHISRHDPGRRKCDGSNRNAHKGFLGHTAKHLSALGMDGKHHLHEKSSFAFVADLSYPADLTTMRQVDVGRIKRIAGAPKTGTWRWLKL